MRFLKRSTLFGCASVLILGMMAAAAMAQEPIIRAEINPPDGTKITFSAPISLLEMVKESVPSAMVDDKSQIAQMVDELIGELASIKGKDLVRVDAEAKVRVWVDEANGDNPEETNFIQVWMKPAQENAPEVQFRIPKGLLMLISCIGDQFMEKHGEEILQAIKENIPHPPMIPMVPPQPPEMKDKEGKEWKEEKSFDPENLKKEIFQNIMKELQKNMDIK